MAFNEARLAAQLTHENILQVYELAEAEGQLHIAMEFVEGEGLSKIVKKEGQNFTIDEVIKIGAQVGRAIGAAGGPT